MFPSIKLSNDRLLSVNDLERINVHDEGTFFIHIYIPKRIYVHITVYVVVNPSSSSCCRVLLREKNEKEKEYI